MLAAIRKGVVVREGEVRVALVRAVRSAALAFRQIIWPFEVADIESLHHGSIFTSIGRRYTSMGCTPSTQLGRNLGINPLVTAMTYFTYNAKDHHDLAWEHTHQRIP